MDFNRRSSPEAVVSARPTGVNGIPETFVDDDMLETSFGSISTDSPRRFVQNGDGQAHMTSEAYLPWLALGAVVVGGFGALAGLMHRQGRARAASPWAMDPQNATPPHGDMLLHH